MKLRVSLLLLAAVASQTFAGPGYFRSPALHKDTLVFTAEGDLWRWQENQPFAQRLTTHPTEERQAAISPDGKWVAFVADYHGFDEAYVMPMQGGVAKRISYENNRVRVHGWTPKGQVLISCLSGVGPGFSELRLIDPVDLNTESLPLADAVDGSINRNKHLFFVQHGLMMSGDNAHAYQGGATGELWSYKLGGKREATPLSGEHKGSIRNPMTYKKRVYFVSNQSGTDNIWSMDTAGGDLRQHTSHSEWNVRKASLSDGRIAYQLGADIHILDLANNNSRLLPIKLMSDFAQLREHWIAKPLEYLTSANLAPNQKKVVMTARGRIAVAGVDDSRLVEIASAPESRSRNAIMGFDGAWVYALNDASGEMEIWRYAADGSPKAEQITRNSKGFRWSLQPSNDGKWIAHDDKQGNLWLLNTATGKNRKIFSTLNGNGGAAKISWSPDGNYLSFAYSEVGQERPRIVIYDVKNKRHQLLTSVKYSSYSPAFSADGDWLYFLSERNFVATPPSPWGDRNMGPQFDGRTQIFAIALNPEARFPFQPNNELLVKVEHKKDQKAEKGKKESEAQKDVKASNLVWQEMANRLWQVPVAAGNYANLTVNKDFLYLTDRKGRNLTLKSLAIEPNVKLKSFTGGVADYQLSADGKQMLVRKSGSSQQMYIVKAGAKFPSKTDKAKVRTSAWKLKIDPAQEWQQIFQDAWLMHRDSLFDANLRGLDWQKIRKKYQPLLLRLTDRHELNDVFAQMMGELNVLHSQVRGGDTRKDENAPKPASLGASFKQNRKGVQISRIYSGDPELPAQAGPLAKPGVDVKAGDYITSVNGLPISTLAELRSHLLNQAGDQVLLGVKRGRKQHKVVVTPTPSRTNRNLAYRDWVSRNLAKVQKSDANIGYLHLQAMTRRDIASFAREFYAQYDKPALIIDVRRNRGGNIDSWIIEKLLRRVWSFWELPNFGRSTNMQQTFRGHLVVLADEFTYSDGETFTAAVKSLKLGTVIGKQTAGAGVWLTGANRQSDKGIARVAEFPVYDIKGNWVVEGTGVAPDISVDNLPYATYRGNDAQLEKAVSVLQNKLKQQPVKPLKAKPLPDKPAPANGITAIN